MRISDWSSDVCSSDLIAIGLRLQWKSPTPFQVWLGPPLKFAKEFPHESNRGQINRRPPRLRDHRAPAYAVELTMDLNHFSSQHQVALIRASAATDRRARPRHLAAATLICEQRDRKRVVVGKRGAV